MTKAFDPRSVAARLSRGQRSTIRGLDRTPCILGCGEPVARRLARPVGSRPALVVETKGERYLEFALNEQGYAVKAALRELGQ